MEAQNLLSGFCSNPITTPIQNPNQSSSFTLSFSSSFSSPSSSHILLPKRVTFKTLYSLSSKLQCSQKIEAVSGDGEDLKAGISTKNLAVFVSGGGSNFRSIHEATLRRSVHGEVVVLVTNKPGCGGAEYARDNNIPVILFPKMKEKPESLSANGLVTTLTLA